MTPDRIHPTTSRTIAPTMEKEYCTASAASWLNAVRVARITFSGWGSMGQPLMLRLLTKQIDDRISSPAGLFLRSLSWGTGMKIGSAMQHSARATDLRLSLRPWFGPAQ